MRTLLIIGGAIVGLLIGLIAVVVLIGYRLPVSHTASRSIRLQHPVEDVYARIRDFSSASNWRPGVKRVDMLEEVNGHLQFREHGSSDTVTYELIEEVPHERIVTRIVDQDLGYSGSWTYEFAPSDDGALLTITENGEVSNPLFRFISRFVFGHTATIDQYLSDLSNGFNQQVESQN